MKAILSKYFYNEFFGIVCFYSIENTNGIYANLDFLVKNYDTNTLEFFCLLRCWVC